MLQRLMIGGLLSLAVAFAQQEELNNEAILKMAKAGLSENVIITMVNQQPGRYSTEGRRPDRAEASGSQRQDRGCHCG
jgi:hypothetical protein